MKTLNSPKTAILTALTAKAGKESPALQRPQIAEKAEKLGFSVFLGRLPSETKNYEELTAAKLIKQVKLTIDGTKGELEAVGYQITPAGKAALEAHLEAAKAKAKDKANAEKAKAKGKGKPAKAEKAKPAPKPKASHEASEEAEATE